MLIYIASPYTLGDPVTNVNRQIDAAEALCQRGHVPIVPLLSHYWHERYQHDWQFWLNLCKGVVPTADAVLRLDGESKGADVEVALAQDIGLPVYYRIEDVPVVGNEEQN